MVSAVLNNSDESVWREDMLSAVERGLEWWRGAAIYQIYPRSFADSNGDGIGDLAGIAARLDYVAELGVDAIWISPFFTSPMADFGYDVADYCDVDPIFGTLADFDTLVVRAHALGLKVIIDQVYCHTSDQHRWFQTSRASPHSEKADWYVWADPKPDGTPPNNWLSVFGGAAWTWDGRRRQYYLHHFLKAQPTLNLHNTAVVDALIDVGRFWIERGVDGFRLDAINVGLHDEQLRDNPPLPDSAGFARPFDMQQHRYSMSHPKMETIIEQMSAAFRKAAAAQSLADFFTIAEIGGAEPFAVMSDYTRGATRLSAAYSFDFIGAPAPIPTHIRATLEQWPNALDKGYPAFAISNHDCPRVASRWALDGAPLGVAEKLYALLHAAWRGVTFIYQGEELGLPQVDIPYHQLLDPEAIANWPNDQGRDGARTPMPWHGKAMDAGFGSPTPWLPIADAHRRFAVDIQDKDADSILATYRTALRLRKTMEILRRGDVYFIDSDSSADSSANSSKSEAKASDANLICFKRQLGKEEALCALNLGSESAPLPIAEIAHITATGQTLLAVSLQQPIASLTRLPPYSGFLAYRG